MADNAPVSAEALSNGKAHGESTEVAQEYPILPKLIPYLDRHLIFPLLEFLSGQEGEEEQDLTRTKYELLKQTNMTDYVASLWQELNGSDQVPEEYTRKREEVLQRLSLFTEETSKIDELLSDDSVVSNLRSDKVANLKFLEANHNVTSENIDMLHDFGRFQYSCGSYANAAHLLDQFRILSTDNEKVTSATWGKLACDILTTQWEVVMEEVNKVKESIDTKLFNNPLAQLEHRTWLIHWILFPYFNYEPAKDTITDLFFSPAFINTIQTNCPWILRYLAAAIITNRNRTRNSGQYQKQLKDLVRIVRQEGYEYNDPLTDFIKALYIDFDFEAAQSKLGEAEELLEATSSSLPQLKDSLRRRDILLARAIARSTNESIFAIYPSDWVWMQMRERNGSSTSSGDAHGWEIGLSGRDRPHGSSSELSLSAGHRANQRQLLQNFSA